MPESRTTPKAPNLTPLKEMPELHGTYRSCRSLIAPNLTPPKMKWWGCWRVVWLGKSSLSWLHCCAGCINALAGRMKSLDFGYELEIMQVQILSVTVTLFISTIDLVLYRLSSLFCLIRSLHRSVAHEDGQNKA
ncbi:hypothetical protein J6590_090106 [Homalodisca vitripennis]|nr:hypothetical protein J6590_090106 [Homalodisca vitripennis]